MEWVDKNKNKAKINAINFLVRKIVKVTNYSMGPTIANRVKENREQKEDKRC